MDSTEHYDLSEGKCSCCNQQRKVLKTTISFLVYENIQYSYVEQVSTKPICLRCLLKTVGLLDNLEESLHGKR